MKTEEDRRLMQCPFCGHQTTSTGRPSCGPHKLNDGTYHKAVQMQEMKPNYAACCAEGGGAIPGCDCVYPNHVPLGNLQ